MLKTESSHGKFNWDLPIVAEAYSVEDQFSTKNGLLLQPIAVKDNYHEEFMLLLEESYELKTMKARNSLAMFQK